MNANHKPVIVLYNMNSTVGTTGIWRAGSLFNNLNFNG